MTEDDLIKLFTQQLLQEDKEPQEEIIEEGFFDRMKVRAKTFKSRLKNKAARIGGKLGVYDKEGVARADMVFIDELGAELDKLYKPRFEKLFRKYFKDSAILTGSIIDDHGIDKKMANMMWQRMSSPQVMDQVYEDVKQSLMQAVIKEAEAAGLKISSI